MRLSAVIDELVEERGLERSILSSVICEGMLAAYRKKYPHLTLQASYNKKTDEVEIEVEKEVVSSVEDEELQISVRKAKQLDSDVKVGGAVWVSFDGTIGRIEILKAKQVIASKIRTIEAEVVYNEFKEKEGTIVHGVVHKVERNGVTVKLQETHAFLPKSLTIPGDKLVVGYPIRALLKEVLLESRRDNQLILDRISHDFLQRLFELEIPEVFEKIIEIKKIVRIPGYKSKVVVISHDSNIDPVGTCIGVGGARIKPILKELGGEKIDVIAEGDSLEELIKFSLKPAEIKGVQLVDDNSADVWLNEDQRSLAIGRMGQNILLASRLTGVKINLVQDETTEQKKLEQDDLGDLMEA